MRKIGADIGQVVRSPDMVQRFTALGMEPVGSTPEAYDQVIATEIDKWTRVVRQANIKVE